MRAALRALPSVEALRLAVEQAIAPAIPPLPRDVAAYGPALNLHITDVAREALSAARTAIQHGEDAPTLSGLVTHVVDRLRDRALPVLRPVINATGVIVNTNLGRAPLSAMALVAASIAARGYSNLEYDLEAGERGSRQTPTRALLRELTGAEDALVVNNNAAATLVALAALTVGREVIVSRGELVEIGGGFRVPDVMRQSGARLVEVGTTNRTRVADYAAAITPDTAALLSVHPSNFRVVGFTEAPALAELAALAHAHNLPLLHDLGSGALVATEAHGLAHEPTVRESVAAGADVVCFSGDKLLGGPQAGIIVGRATLLAQIARQPLMRAVRIDKLTLAALEATLLQWRDGQATHAIPIWRMITTPLADLRARADHWAAAIRAWDDAAHEEGDHAGGTGHADYARVAVDVIAGESTVGGGSLPGETLPTWLCAISLHGRETDARDGVARRGAAPEVGELARRLRIVAPPATPVVARVSRDRLLLDPRTVPPEQDEALLATLRGALGGG
jgi:L-seryl-tRNA(Ser) seleniumtransferase